MSARELVVGFDLDMTLIDTRPGFGATLAALSAELGIELPIAALTERLGPPLDLMLAPYLPEERIGPAIDRFRELYVDLAVPVVPAFAGAHEAVEAVLAAGGRTLLVTGKYAANAHRHLAEIGLPFDEVVGEVWGTGKAAALIEHGASIYVGDHIHDVEGALAAGVVSVSVLSGGGTREEFVAAGTSVVLDSVADFPEWLAEHLLEERATALAASLGEHDRVLVAFSGGADSAFLLAAAVRALGPSKVTAATAYSDALPTSERSPAMEFAHGLGVEVLTPQTHEIDRDGYRRNEGDRCAFCKTELIDVLTPLAAERGAVVLTGTNADDVRAGFRPGIAAAADKGAVTPLADAGLTKAQIRELSRRWNLPTWDKPAAACLSSRVAYGIEITRDRLARVEAAEAALRARLPERANLRVRDLGDTARVEVDAYLIPLVGAEMLQLVRDAGFAEAEVDPRGFRSGAMNELLADPDRYR